MLLTLVWLAIDAVMACYRRCYGLLLTLLWLAIDAIIICDRSY